MVAVGERQFQDADWVRRLIDRFADYYFDALNGYDSRHTSLPSVWLHVHDTTLNGRLSTLQRLLLGINAHINYDLVLALVDVLREDWQAADADLRTRRYTDHCQVNAVIGRSIDAVQDTIIAPEEPGMEVLDRLLGPLDEWLLSRLIASWREDVWRHAVVMLDLCDDEACESIRRQVERDTLRRARLIAFV